MIARVKHSSTRSEARHRHVRRLEVLLLGEELVCAGFIGCLMSAGLVATQPSVGTRIERE